MSPFLRKVKTASGAMAVQIAVKEGRRDKVIEHLGSAHTQAELAALMEIGRRRIAPDQLALDLSPVPSAPPPASSGPANVGAVVAVEVDGDVLEEFEAGGRRSRFRGWLGHHCFQQTRGDS